MMRDALVLNRVSKSFDGLRAVDAVTFAFEPGKVTAIVGGNGAGKTTLFHTICGTLQPDSGEILWRGTRVDGLPCWQVARLGIGRLFQEVRIFPRLTVMENILVSFPGQSGENLWRIALSPRLVGKEEQENKSRAAKLLEYVGLSAEGKSWADTLSYGEQKLLAIARLLAGGAEALLLDEPTAGIAQDAIPSITKIMRALAEDGKTVVVIEHNPRVVEEVADSLVRMEHGRIEERSEKLLPAYKADPE